MAIDTWEGSWGSSWGLTWVRPEVVPPDDDEPPELGGGKIVATGRGDNRTSATTFSRERFKALKAVLRAEEEARERARSFKRKKDRVVTAEAVAEVSEAVDAARKTAIDAKSAEKFRRVAVLLDGAAHAKALADFLAKVEEARQIALLLVEGRIRAEMEAAAADAAEAALAAIRAEEEDEDEAMALLLLS